MARSSCCTAPGRRQHVPAADHRPDPRLRRRRAARGRRRGQHRVDGALQLLHGAWPAPPAHRREYPRSIGAKCRVCRGVVSGAMIFSDVYLNKLQKKFCDSNFCSTYAKKIPTYARKIPTSVTLNGQFTGDIHLQKSNTNNPTHLSGLKYIVSM